MVPDAVDPRQEGEAGAGERGAGRRDPAGLTSMHVRRAREGDGASLEWLIRRLTPPLLASARRQLQGKLRALYDPEDLVHEVWLVALPKLRELPLREGRYTPVLLKFLSGTLVNKVGNLLQKHVLGKVKRAQRGGEDGGTEAIARVPDSVTGILVRLIRSETRSAVLEALEELSPQDREVLVLRGVDGSSYKAIGAVLGVDPAVIPMRYKRALERLRKRLPGSVYEELVEE
ncbi:MAG: sigma-70 family RNA polymerase sigma factor [Planctomycetes bacterium]|nr:sigma-70 family RNA polymerase sigma factor [Planctomycetota bacterium]